MTDHTHDGPRYRMTVNLPCEMVNEMDALIAKGDFVGHSDLVEAALRRTGVVGMADEASQRVRDAIDRARHGNVKEGSTDFAVLGELSDLFARGHPCAMAIAKEIWH